MAGNTFGRPPEQPGSTGPQPNVLVGEVQPAPARRGGISATVVLWLGVGLLAATLVGYLVYNALYAARVIEHRHDVPGMYTVFSDFGSTPTDSIKTSGSSCRVESPEMNVGSHSVMSVEDDAGVVLASAELRDGQIAGNSCVWHYTLRDLPEIPAYTFKLDGRPIQRLDLASMNLQGWQVGWLHDLVQPADDLR